MKRKGSEPTISQVAAMAGVSIATVSRVLNDPSKVRPATVEKVSAAIDTLAYPRPQPAMDLRNRLIVAVLPNLDNPFYSKSSRAFRYRPRVMGWRFCSMPRATWTRTRAACWICWP